jgi:hypothetical protein
MFATLFALQIDNMDLARTLHSFHLVQAAVYKEECDKGAACWFLPAEM